MKNVIDIQNLFKTYADGKEALKDVNIQIQENEFVALLGPNGAGKSTTINVLGGNVEKTSGNVKICGFDLDEDELETKKRIGIIPQEVTFDSFFTVNEVLLNQSGYFGITDNQEYIDELLEHLSLTDKKHVNTKALSGGMKRRLLIAKALVHNPEVIILDEPTAGVDIELRQQLYVFLKKLHKEGKTIILTTHYLEEAEELCERVIIINKGEVIADEEKSKLKSSLGENAVIEFFFEKDIKKKDFDFLSDFSPVFEKTSLKVSVGAGDVSKLFAKMSHRNIEYSGVQTHEMDLEDIFLKLVT